MGADMRVSGNTVTPMVRELRHNPEGWGRQGEPVDLSCVESVTWVRFGPCGGQVDAYRGEVFDAAAGRVMLSAVGWPTVDGDGGPLTPWTDLEGLTRWRIRVESCADLDGVKRVWEFPGHVNSFFYVCFVKGSDMTAAVRVPVIPTCKDEVGTGAALPVGNPDGFDLFNLVAGDGSAIPHTWNAVTGQWAPLAAAGAADVDSYLHTQAAAAAVWLIPHNLGRDVTITAFTGPDPTNPGSEIEGQVLKINSNNHQITFTTARSGHAIIT